MQVFSEGPVDMDVDYASDKNSHREVTTMPIFTTPLRRCALIALIPIGAQVSCHRTDVPVSTSLGHSQGASSSTAERSSSNGFVPRSFPTSWGTYVARTPITRDQQVAAISQDLQSLSQRDRLFVRYLTLSHLYNLGVPDDELEASRVGAGKAINSLSTARAIAIPKPIDSERTIFRIDLREYRWSRQTWDVVARQSEFDIIGTDNDARQLQNATGTRHPTMRVDTFTASAFEPDVYHFILDIPRNIRTLESRLGINRFRNLLSKRAFRVGFTGSGVSQANRILERHETQFGYYWRSIDFAPGDGRRDRNIFAFPLDNGLRGQPGFREAGGEIIFSLPNGLQAYVLIDANGQRINEPPTNVVGDPARPDMAVQNGVSCHRCHNGGMIGTGTIKDEVVPHVDANPIGFRTGERDLIKAIYTDETTLRDAYTRDAQRFKEAISPLGLSPDTPDPIAVLVQRFEAQHVGIDLDTVAAELGISPDTLKQGISRSPRLARDLGTIASGGRIQREVLRDIFPVAVRILGLGFTSGGFTGGFGRNRSVSYDDSDQLPGDPESRDSTASNNEDGSSWRGWDSPAPEEPSAEE